MDKDFKWYLFNWKTTFSNIAFWIKRRIDSSKTIILWRVDVVCKQSHSSTFTSLLSWISICVTACYFGRQITFAVGKIGYCVSIFLSQNITKTIYLKERVNTKEELYHLNVGMCRLPFYTSQEKVWILKKRFKDQCIIF